MSKVRGMRRILIVCGGNTCRSPMAKIILEQMLRENGLERQFEVDSAAYDGADGTSAHANSRNTILKRYGADLLADHVPKKLTDEMVEKADLIIVMVERMKGGSLAGHKVVVLGIPDPFDQPEERYDECADAIERRFMQIWPEISGPVPVLPRTEAVSSVILPPLSVSLGSTSDYDEVRIIAEKYQYGQGGWNKAHAEKVGYLTQRIAHQLVKQNLLAVAPTYPLLAMAIALPHDIGRNPRSIGKAEHNERSFRTLKKEMQGSALSQDEITIIQYCALFHTGDEWKNTPITGKTEIDKLVKTWAGILRIADGLDRGLSQRVSDITITPRGKEILIKVVASTSCITEIEKAREKSDLLKVLGWNITVK